MKKFFIFLSVVAGLFAVLIVVGLLNAPPKPPTASERAESLYAARQDPHAAKLKFVGHSKAVITYSLADPNDPVSLKDIARQAKFICDESNSTICIVGVWKNEADAAKFYPMTDQQVETQYLQYWRNLNTGLEEVSTRNAKGEMEPVPASAFLQ